MSTPRRPRRKTSRRISLRPPTACSVPRLLLPLFPPITPSQETVCAEHDAKYGAGGTRRERAIADAWALLGWLSADMDVDQAEKWHAAIRLCGKPHWGGGRYTDDQPTSRDAQP